MIISGGFSALNFFFHQRTCSDGIHVKQFHYFTGRMNDTCLVCSSPRASEHALGLEHDDVQVGKSLAVLNVIACHFSDLQGGSSSQRLHLSQEARAARLIVYPAQQEVPVVTLETHHGF